MKVGAFTLGYTIVGESKDISEIPLGKRIESFESEESSDVMTEMRTQKKVKKTPKTGSMEVLLSQYIETNDYSQIDNVLSIEDERVRCGCRV